MTKDTMLNVSEVDGLRTPRSRVSRHRLVTAVLLANLVAKGAIIGFLAHFSNSADVRDVSSLLQSSALYLLEFEIISSMIFVEKWCRWENQRHLITTWQVLVALEIFFARRSLYVRPEHFGLALIILVGAYFVGVMADFRQTTPIRLPPFPEKVADIEKPKYGWLGPGLAELVKKKWMRMGFTLVMWLSYQTKVLLFLYYGSLKEHDDLTNVPFLNTLFVISTVVTFVCLVPNSLVVLASMPELFRDCWFNKKSSNLGQTGPYEVCELDDDKKEHSSLAQQLKSHTCRSLTVVVPCYLPNEEEIIFDVIEYYKQQQVRYPGTMRMMIVWNSPKEHPEAVHHLDQAVQGWSSLSVHRNRWSTSKCDNLNMAIDLLNNDTQLRTDFALLNDADTMVSAETMARASCILYDQGYDIAQSHSTHCYMDRVGKPESGCFCFGPLVTLFDSTKPLNMSTQGHFNHSPFNGRGGFWRTEALQKVGFDHRSIGEDHDAAYRGFAAFGLKGIMDQNLLCQEREAPDCKSLTNQRIRWETAALEMRRTFPWILRSKFYGRLEAFVLIWSQLSWNCNLPLQQAPFQMIQLMQLAVTKAFLLRHVYGTNLAVLCSGETCVHELEFQTASGRFVAFPVLLVVMLAVFAVYQLLNFTDFCLRLQTTRYRPRALWVLFNLFVVPLVMMPYLMYLQFWALNDYCWGGAEFICTARSSISTISTALPSASSMGNVDMEYGQQIVRNDMIFNESKVDLKKPLLLNA